MLDIIRRHQKSWITYLIFAGIIVVFAVNFGPGSGSCHNGGAVSYAAMVNGEYIAQQDFAIAYSHQLEQMRRRAQASNFDFTEEMAQRMGLHHQVIDGLINNKLLAREAERLGLRVSDAELLEYLHNLYKVKDVDVSDYRNFVERNFRTSVQRFEQERRDELLAQKVAQFLQDSVTVNDNELRDDYMRNHDRAKIEYVKFDVASAKLVEPTAAEIKKLIESEPQAISDRYQIDAALYRTAEERQARQIVLNVAKDASEADIARLRSKLITLKEQISSGADFAALCQEFSQDDATKAKGGDLGWHKRGDLAPEIEKAIFSLAANEIVKEPVRSSDNLYLIQLVAIKPSQLKPQAEVQNEVAASILRERSVDQQLSVAAKELLEKLKNGQKFETLTINSSKTKNEPKEKMAKKTNDKKDKPDITLQRHETEWITKTQEALPQIGIAPELKDAVFTLSKEAPIAPKTYKVGKAYYVMVLKDRETPDVTKFESEKDSLREQALWSKRNRVFQEWMQHLRSLARVELNPALFADSRQSANPDEG
ncbi:MAG: SurA N-terminal domain-containing protein [Deltaproteobacteria bacterium]|nr:SurA N-terminal domain-containing protein [Deltaproteobacteria bacterium]